MLVVPSSKETQPWKESRRRLGFAIVTATVRPSLRQAIYCSIFLLGQTPPFTGERVKGGLPSIH